MIETSKIKVRVKRYSIKSLIRAVYLNKLANIPLNKQLKNIDGAITYIQNILDTVVMEKNVEAYGSDLEFYFIKNKIFYIFDKSNDFINCRYQDFWCAVWIDYDFSYSDTASLFKEVFENHLNKEIKTIDYCSASYSNEIEYHFRKDK